jgi:glycerol-3-phosphate O-acyltransferase
MAGLRRKVRRFVNDLFEWIRFRVWSLIAYFFYSIRVDPKWEEEVKRVAGRGRIVHVIRTVHLLDSLCLVYFSRRVGLPPIGYVYGLQQWFLRPFRWIYRFMTYQERKIEDKKHANAVLDMGGSIIISLRRTPKTLKRRGMEMGEEALGWLVERVRERGERIILVPHAFVWGRRPEKQDHGVIDRIFGPRESPGVIRSIIQVVRSFRSANIIAAEPVDLKAFIDEFPGTGEAGTMEGVLQRRLAADIDRRRTIVAGPVTRSRYRTADLILADTELVDVVRGEAKKTGKTEDEIRTRVRGMLDEIMPDYHYAFIGGWEVMLKAFGIFDKVFDGIYLEPQEHEMLKNLAARGPVILLSGHRSHVDYILLSWVFGHESDLMVPYIAAGKNLSFWPLGWWFRGSGAFFIRRTLGSDVLYKEVLAAFIRRIVLDGNHVEIFMEGTRSRSGKALPPKLGLFSMVLDAVERLPAAAEVNFLPVAINYERVIEEQSYSLEQSGRDKRSENIRGLYETQDVLESRFGRIYVRFGKPYSIQEMRRDKPSLRDHDGVRRLAYSIFYEMDRSFHITPTGLAATVLLCGPHSGVGEADFFRDAVFYLKFAVSTGKKVSHVLRPCLELGEGDIGDEADPAWKELREVMYHAIHLLASDDLVTMSAGGGGVYHVPEHARVRLDYYKNAFYGTMGPHALACRSFLAFGMEAVDMEELKAAARFLSKLLKYEFIFNPRLSFDANYAATLSMLETMRLIEIDGARRIITVRKRREVEKVGVLVESLLESYYLTTRAVASHPGKGMSEREIVRRVFGLHERLLLEREISHAESRNRSAVGYCLKALEDRGVLVEGKKNTYDVSEPYRRREKIESLASDIYRFVRLPL